MNYNPEIWSDLDQEEKKAYHLYEAFQKQTNKLGLKQKWLPQATAKSCYDYDRDGKYPGDKIREAKNWRYFVETCEIFQNYPDFEPEIFVEAVFRTLMKGQRVYPAQLRTKKAIDAYNEYRMKMKMTTSISDEKRMMEDIANTFKYIKKKIKKDEIDTNDLYRFFNEVEDNNVISEGIRSCILEMISPFYFSISKSFRIAFNNSDQDIKDEIISEQKLNNIAALVKMKTHAYKIAKKLFGNDIL